MFKTSVCTQTGRRNRAESIALRYFCLLEASLQLLAVGKRNVNALTNRQRNALRIHALLQNSATSPSCSHAITARILTCRTCMDCLGDKSERGFCSMITDGSVVKSKSQFTHDRTQDTRKSIKNLYNSWHLLEAHAQCRYIVELVLSSCYHFFQL